MNPLTTPRHVWTYRGFYLAICLYIIIHKLLPLGLNDAGFPGPDLLLAVTFVWLLRQPAIVPIGAILGIFLLADFLFDRPPGLWTLMVIIVSESLRRRRLMLTEFPFLVEWAVFTGAVFAMVLLNRVVLWVLFVDLDPLGLTLTQAILTIGIYPLVVLVSKYILRLRKIGPADVTIG